MNKENVITLDNPVKRGEQVIEQVTLMKPNAGTLRGVMGTVSALVRGSPDDAIDEIRAKAVAAKADYYVILMVDETVVT
ncbi:DUF1471 domain-containing protein, partial [Salmonella enterica subsp. enterica serovar Virginia]|nr:DUF1471 domain-containing protein [Salmonella enterica subsp. enterica serovar Virginia]